MMSSIEPRLVDEATGLAPVASKRWYRRRWPFFGVVATVLLVCDQLSKFWVIGQLTSAFWPEGSALSLPEKLTRFWQTGHPAAIAEKVVFDSWWKFQYVENPGAAWGVLSHSDSMLRTPFFIVIALLAMGFLLRYAAASKETEMRLRFALAIVFGGALGNFIDRIRLGYVIDFVDWHLGQGFHWPTFNVADAGISVGVLLLMLDAARERN